MSKYVRVDKQTVDAPGRSSSSMPPAQPHTVVITNQDVIPATRTDSLRTSDPYGSSTPTSSSSQLTSFSSGTQRVYLHRNGHLISEQLIPPPARPHNFTYVEPVNPRAALAAASSTEFEPCPCGNQPNPCWEYHQEMSGFATQPTVSWWQFITFGWVSPLIATGFKRAIDEHDLFILPEVFQSRNYTSIMFESWHRNRDREKWRFAWTIWHAFSPILKKMWCIKIFMIALILLRPVIFSLLLQNITNGGDRWIGIGLILTLSSCSMIHALCHHHFWWYGVAVAMASRGSCIGLVYDKSLKLHSSERSQWNAGRISNLANVDCDNIRDFMWGAVHEIWGGPVMVTLTSGALILLLGVSALVGVGLLAASMYLTHRLCDLMQKQQDVIMYYGDQRVGLMSELITNMRLIKLYAWESFFARAVFRVREKQMKSVLSQEFVSSVNRCLGLIVPLLVSFLTFTCFILTNGYGSFFSHTLDASTAFTSLLLFNILKEPLGKLPDTLNNFIRLKISMERLETFLITKEKEQYVDEVDQTFRDDSSSSNSTASSPSQSTSTTEYDVTIDGTFDWGVRIYSESEETERMKRQLSAEEAEAQHHTTAHSQNGLAHSGSTVTFRHDLPPPMHVISDEPEDEEEEEEDESDVVSTQPMSLADEIRHEQERKVKLEKKNKKKGASPSETNGIHGEDVIVDLTPTSAEGHTLPNLQLRIPQGQLWMIVGQVGSGKSSLLHSILGEMTSYEDASIEPPPPTIYDSDLPPLHHPIKRRRRIGYTSQVAWLESASIRANILFGLPYHSRRYEETIHVCALEPDLKRFKLGDATIVGENGLTLSGGQKARLVLARAVYANADLYLFDEPLAAVDAHVARWLFERAIGPESILKHKTRILVTHQLQFASPAIDCIVVLKNGKIQAQGTYREVAEQGVDLSTILQQTHNLQAEAEYEKSIIDDSDEDEQEGKENQRPHVHPMAHLQADETQAAGAANGKLSSPSASNGAHGLECSPTPLSPDEGGAEGRPAAGQKDPAAPQQYVDENLQVGVMSNEIYKEYFRSGGSLITYIFVGCFVVISQCAAIGSDYFLAFWSTSITHAVAAAQSAADANLIAATSNVTSQSFEHTSAFSGFLLDPWSTHASITTTPTSINFGISILINSTASTSYVDYLPHAHGFYIGIYGILVLVAGLLVLIRSSLISLTTVKSARVLHNRLFNGVIHAPQWFFESTPSGRILNRFAKDQEQVDTKLPGCVLDIVQCGVVVAGTIVLIIFLAPLSVFPLILIGLLYLNVQRYYHPTSRQLKRLESVTRSPIYQLIGETASGVTTIRAYAYHGSMERCMAEMYQRIDLNTRVMYYSFSVHRWLGVRLEAIGALIVIVAGSLAILLSNSLGVGLVALSISTTLGLSSNLNWTVRQVSEMENQLNSVERILEYAKVEPEETNPDDEEGEGHTDESKSSEWIVHSESELKGHKKTTVSNKPETSSKPPPNSTSKSKKPSKKQYISLETSTEEEEWDGEDEDDETQPGEGANHDDVSIEMTRPSLVGWPSVGSIEFRNLSLAYRPTPTFPCVLTNVNAHIRGGEKIGIVGRTGAGKSTLALGLFRLIQIRAGQILIDGIDISTIRLHDLRSRLSVIPQDPLLFQSTLRSNLDPFHTVTDQRLWEVLKEVQLADLISTLPDGLNYLVTDGGENFSLGQRQLLCLARAIVRESKIIIMDEATSSIDYETSEMLKELVNRQFKDCTVLTIAHRLNTILDADRIMVFEGGRLVEFDTPKKLLSDSTGYFSWLVKETNVAGQIHRKS